MVLLISLLALFIFWKVIKFSFKLIFALFLIILIANILKSIFVGIAIAAVFLLGGFFVRN
ncbi:hypothetical protein LB941_07960 [Ligilactobacillus sp. WILCCON 0076]|uniref:Uncharacterized protein n=1 Tax=Ligilactobacillus ubinensis TaxID=2876789 RepID=A0A9X2JMX7_9LACO|nr:hypothetical protein [Ligilactobacillus ubinensis]MCP0887266.1 hypothetical protein [Ligilactobacillus ubinensis]